MAYSDLRVPNMQHLYCDELTCNKLSVGTLGNLKSDSITFTTNDTASGKLNKVDFKTGNVAVVGAVPDGVVGYSFSRVGNLCNVTFNWFGGAVVDATAAIRFENLNSLIAFPFDIVNDLRFTVPIIIDGVGSLGQVVLQQSSKEFLFYTSAGASFTIGTNVTIEGFSYTFTSIV